jgi:hypothetical protein
MVLDVSLPRVTVHVGGGVFGGYTTRKELSRALLLCTRGRKLPRRSVARADNLEVWRTGSPKQKLAVLWLQDMSF